MPEECPKNAREMRDERSKNREIPVECSRNARRAPEFPGAIMPIAPLESDSTPKAG
jgi:hypothetical protein